MYPSGQIEPGAQNPARGGAVPASPSCQTALSAAWNRRKAEAPHSAGLGAGGAALRAARLASASVRG
eukprot:2963682-Alexandrium_andersonii.AAC.1